MAPHTTIGLLASSAIVLMVVPAHAEDRCIVLCRPVLAVEPTLSIDDLVGPRVEDVMTGQTRELSADSGFELSLAVGIATQIPRVGLTLESIIPIPTAPVELDLELNIALLTEDTTGGWIGVAFDIIDQLGPGQRPGTEGSYSHELDLELEVAFLLFNWLPDGHWLRNLELDVSLDYQVTGSPKRGDVIDGERYLEDARGLSASLALALPLAPLVPE